MRFPLNKKIITTNNSKQDFLAEYKNNAEIPLYPHPGAFGAERKYHIHEGVDIYCMPGDEVYSICEGYIIDIFPFTGTLVGSPWWQDTYAVLVGSATQVLNYGEIIFNPNLKIGDKVSLGSLLGKVTPVLKNNKGRPMCMLHLEMYTPQTKKAIMEWSINTSKPAQLIDPTQLLLKLAKLN